jgi:hypothetical protein
MILSLSVSILIGALKEIGDIYSWWWMCPCQGSWKDLVADALGAVAGVLSLQLIHVKCSPALPLGELKLEQPGDQDSGILDSNAADPGVDLLSSASEDIV